MAKKFKCNVCGYIHEGDTAPESCPVCSAPASEFTEIQDEQGAPVKKGFFSNTNSNGYILFYSAVMVILVAALLSVVSLSLQKRQYANQLNEKKQSILASLDAADQNYDEFINGYVINKEGQKIEGDVFDLMKDLKSAFAAEQYPVFEAKDGRLVLPLTGTGLWGPIWGYISINGDMNTVGGIIMDHQGETPGLGAEIATAKYQAKFVGKQIYKDNEFVSVYLRKGGADKNNIDHEVDAITGGTKTSEGVSNMLRESISHYLPLIEARRVAAQPQVVEVATVAGTEEAAEEVSNEVKEK